MTEKMKRRPLIIVGVIIGAVVLFLGVAVAAGIIWLARNRAAYQSHRNPTIAPRAESLNRVLPPGSTYSLASTYRDSSGESETYRFNLSKSVTFTELSSVIGSWAQSEFEDVARFRCVPELKRESRTFPATCGWEVNNRATYRSRGSSFSSAIVTPAPPTEGHDPVVQISELSVWLQGSE